jgi:hypothetical protein
MSHPSRSRSSRASAQKAAKASTRSPLSTETAEPAAVHEVYDEDVQIRRGRQHVHGIVKLVDGDDDNETDKTINKKRSASQALDSDDDAEVVELEELTDEQKSAFEERRLRLMKLNRTPGAKEIHRGQLLVREHMAEGIITPFHTTLRRASPKPRKIPPSSKTSPRSARSPRT